MRLHGNACETCADEQLRLEFRVSTLLSTGWWAPHVWDLGAFPLASTSLTGDRSTGGRKNRRAQEVSARRFVERWDKATEAVWADGDSFGVRAQVERRLDDDDDSSVEEDRSSSSSSRAASWNKLPKNN